MQEDEGISAHAEGVGELLTHRIEGLHDRFWSLFQSKDPRTEPPCYYSDSQVLLNPNHPW